MLVLMVDVASEIAGSFDQKTLCTITCSPCLLFLPLPMLAFNMANKKMLAFNVFCKSAAATQYKLASLTSVLCYAAYAGEGLVDWFTNCANAKHLNEYFLYFWLIWRISFSCEAYHMMWFWFIVFGEKRTGGNFEITSFVFMCGVDSRAL